MALVAPSVLAADWGRIDEEVAALESQGADWLHLDVMDGQFVPPITFGAAMVKAIKKRASKTLDVHLMIERPEQHVQAFADAGADIITVHYEASPHLHRTIQQIHGLGLKAGVALNPATPVHVLESIVADVDLVLVMTVNPGWGGQSFIEASVRKIEAARALIDRSASTAELEVDGGIDDATGARACKAGATVLVAGTYILGHPHYGERIASLQKL